MVAVWAAAPLQHPVVPLVLAVVLADAGTGPVSPLIIPFWSLNFAFCVWLYWEGLKVNARASARAQRTWWEPAALLLLLPLFALWEATASRAGSPSSCGATTDVHRDHQVGLGGGGPA